MKITLLKLLLSNLGAWGFIAVADVQEISGFMQLMEPMFKSAAYLSATLLSLGSFTMLFFKKKEK